MKYTTAPLNEVCKEIIDCVNKTAPFVDYETPFKMLRTTNVKKGFVDIETVRYVTEETYRKWTRRKKPKKNDIIFTREAPLGEVGLLRSDDNVFLGQRLIQYRANPKVMDQLFLYYAFQDGFMQSQILSYGSGSTVEHLRIGDCETIKVRYPELPIQQKIASILSNYDDLIENNNRRIQLLEEMASEIYKEWFVRLRFLGYENFNFETSKKLKLRKCLNHYIGGGWGEEYPKGKNTVPAHVIRGTDFPEFNKGTLNFDVLRYHTSSNLSSRVCEPNDIIFEVSGGTESQSLGRTCFISKSALDRFDAPVICASFCKLLRVDESLVSPIYINELLNRMHKTGELKVFQVQSTGISNYQFEDFIEATKIFIPPVDVQNNFDSIVAPMYDEIQTLGAKNQVLQETRDLLLPRLISGKLSVEHLLNESYEQKETIRTAAEPAAVYETNKE